MINRLGEIIKDTREYKEVTRAELAEYAFVTEEQTEEFEQNRAVPDFDTALLICYFLDIYVDWGFLNLINEIANF